MSTQEVDAGGNYYYNLYHAQVSTPATAARTAEACPANNCPSQLLCSADHVYWTFWMDFQATSLSRSGVRAWACVEEVSRPPE